MAQFVEELAAFLGWEVDSTELEEFDKHAEKVTDTIKGLSLAVGAAAAGLTAFLVGSTQATAQTVALSNSVGVSAEKIEALTGALKPLGFETDNVIDLVEEMNNKIGESTGLGEPMTAVAEATKILGLEFQNLKKLKPEDQFIAILDAATQLDDAQQAVSAVDMLMGGEANKIVGFLRSQNIELLEQIQHYAQLNFLTNEGRQGAVEFTNSLNDLMFSVMSIGSEIAGLAGGSLAELIDGWTEWIKVNRELIKQKIKKWVDRIVKALKWLWTWGKRVATVISNVVEDLGGFENVVKLVGIAIASMITARTIIMITTFAKGVKAAGIATTLMNAAIGFTPIVVAGVVALLGLLAEDLYHFFTGGESLVGELGDKIAEFAHMEVRPFIASLMGMTPEEFDMAVVKVVDRVEKFFTEDIPNAWQMGVDAIESIIAFAIEDLWPVINQIYDFFVDVFNRITSFVGNKINAIANEIRSTLSLIPGVDLEPIKNTRGAAGAAAFRSSGTGTIAQAISNISKSAVQAVNQEVKIAVNQQPGENGEALARRMKNLIGQELNRAVKATTSGIE